MDPCRVRIEGVEHASSSSTCIRTNVPLTQYASVRDAKFGGMTGNFSLDSQVFLESVSTAAERFGQSLVAGYESRLGKLQEYHLEKHKEQNAVIERLKAENSELQSRLERVGLDSLKPGTPAQLRGLESRAIGSYTPKAVSPPPALNESTSSNDLKAAYSKLLTKFQLVEGNFKKAKDLLERRKVEREQWANRTAALQKKLDALQRTGHGRSTQTQQPSEAHQIEKPTDTPHSRSLLVSDVLHTHREARLAQEIPNAPVSVHQSPGSTQSDPDDRSEAALPPMLDRPDPLGMIMKQEPSSDSLVVVSERLVRKRKRDTEHNQSSHGNIKVEAVDSSPISRMDHFVPNSEDSLDLSVLPQRISTPRKRRQTLFGQTEEATPSNNVQSSETVLVQSELRRKATTDMLRPAPLTPIDANRRLGKFTVKSLSKRRTPNDVENGIGLLAEDGVYGQPDVAPQGGTETPVPKSRLDDLLNTPGIGEPRPDISRSLARKALRVSTPKDELSLPRPRELPFEKLARANSNKAESSLGPRRSRSPGKGSAGPPRKTHGLLRHKPLSELELDDFKINPQANDGIAFAFSDVVRGKGERAALPGCTDPHCCGEEFRALAISQRPNPPLTSEQLREEQRLLEEYLGDHAHRLATMDKWERENAWIDAKTHELANKYGKHRHRYSRMRSPPGFWNADFPSTQELEAEKAEAAKREHKSIEDRRREAMRPGGRWIFRDE